MISLFVLATPDGRLLAEMNRFPTDSCTVIGAVNPKNDGNYYNQIIVSGRREATQYTMFAEGYLQFLKDSIADRTIEIDPDPCFVFDINEVEILELTSKMDSNNVDN